MTKKIPESEFIQIVSLILKMSVIMDKISISTSPVYTHVEGAYCCIEDIVESYLNSYMDLCEMTVSGAVYVAVDIQNMIITELLDQTDEFGPLSFGENRVGMLIYIHDNNRNDGRTENIHSALSRLIEN